MSSSENRNILFIDDNEQIHRDFRSDLTQFCTSKTEVVEGVAAESGIFTETHSTAESLDELNGVGEERAHGTFRLPVPNRSSAEFEFKIDSAFQGVEACELMRKAEADGNPYALAFVDLEMPPGIDGMETISRLWEISPRLHAVICVPADCHDWIEISDRFGATDQLLLLRKPFDVVEAWQMMVSQTRKWNLVVENQSRLSRMYESIDIHVAELATAHDKQVETNTKLRSAKVAAEQEAKKLKEMSNVLARSESQSRAIIESANDAFFTLNQFGVVTAWTKRAQHVFGWESSQVIGKSIHESLLSDRTEDECGEAIMEIISASMLGQRFEFCLCKSDLGSSPVELSVSKSCEGNYQFFHVFAHDLSQRKHLLMQLGQSQKLEAIGRLAAGISHEINTPIQFIGDNLRFMEESIELLISTFQEIEPVLPMIESLSLSRKSRLKDRLIEISRRGIVDEMPIAIEDSLEGVKHVANIVNAMKKFSHPGGKEKSPANLNEIITNAVTVAHNEWKQFATVEFEFDPQLPMIACLSTELRQVFLNLVINSAHAIESKGEGMGVIKISTCENVAMKAVIVKFTDNGCGIPTEHSSKVFDPFYTTKPVGVGTGQGLAIAWDTIVTKHDGLLDLRSTPGQGTMINITLPTMSRGAFAGDLEGD